MSKQELDIAVTMKVQKANTVINTEEKIDVLIRNNKTDEIVTYEHDGCFEDGVFQDFIWEEGNYACDCNRELFFYRAKNIEEPEETKCGEEKYSVKIIRKSNGEVLYDEFED